MEVTTDRLIADYGLRPHPFEGWSAEFGHIPKQERRFFWLITAEMFIPWHRMPAKVQWSVRSGAPCAVSISTDSINASAAVVGPGFLPTLSIPLNATQTLSSVGRLTLLEARLRPDAALTDRIDRPDNWYPRPEVDDGLPF